MACEWWYLLTVLVCSLLALQLSVLLDEVGLLGRLFPIILFEALVFFVYFSIGAV